jgi:hypothetical protein
MIIELAMKLLVERRVTSLCRSGELGNKFRSQLRYQAAARGTNGCDPGGPGAAIIVMRNKAVGH